MTFRDGTDAAPCTVTPADPGPDPDSYILACPGSDPVLITNGADGDDGQDGGVCALAPAVGGHILTCPDQAPVLIPNGKDGKDGKDGKTCSVTDNGDGSYTLTCDGSPPVTFTNGAPVPGGGDGVEPGASCALKPGGLCLNVDLSKMWLVGMNFAGTNFSSSNFGNTVLVQRPALPRRLLTIERYPTPRRFPPPPCSVIVLAWGRVPSSSPDDGELSSVCSPRGSSPSIGRT